MKKMVLTAIILVVPGSMYSMNRYDKACKHSRDEKLCEKLKKNKKSKNSRRRRITGSFCSGYLTEKMRREAPVNRRFLRRRTFSKSCTL